MTVHLHITPTRGAFPEQRSIIAEGFLPGEAVYLTGRVIDDAGVEWLSSGQYHADARGRVDVAEAPSEGGSYGGVDPSGLFWSLLPGGSDDPDFMVRAVEKSHQLGQPLFDPLAPVTVEITAEGLSGRATGQTVLVRLAEGIDATPVREGRIRGMAFRWRDRSTRRGAIVSLTGSGGGVEMGYAPLLASLGYDVLSLAYFNYEDLPPGIEEIPIEYFQEAFEWIMHCWDPLGIAVQGASRGGELSLLLASYLPEYVKGTIAIVPMFGSTAGWTSSPDKPTASWTLGGIAIPYLTSSDDMSMDDFVVLAKGATAPLALTPDWQKTLEIAREQGGAEFPVERAKGPILMISGVDDAMWPSAWGADVAVARLRAKGFAFSFRHLTLRETGHITPLPNQVTSFCPALYHTLLHVFLACGGNPQGAAMNSRLTWDAIRGHYAEVFPS